MDKRIDPHNFINKKMAKNFFKLNHPFFDSASSAEEAILPVYFTWDEELWRLMLKHEGDVLMAKANTGNAKLDCTLAEKVSMLTNRV